MNVTITIPCYIRDTETGELVDQADLTITVNNTSPMGAMIFVAETLQKLFDGARAPPG